MHKKVISIEYFTGSRFETNKRDIEPIGIFSAQSYWYLIAWCRLRADYRNFRIDKMTELSIQSERFDKQHPKLQDFLKRTQDQEALTKIVIMVDKAAFKYIGDQHYYMGFLSQKEFEEQVEMTFLSSNLTGFAHWFLYLGSAADIIAPASLKKEVGTLLKKISQRMS